VELADLYVRQGDFDRGIAVYRQLLEQGVSGTDVHMKLVDAEALSTLLTLRGEPNHHEFERGFRAGEQATMERRDQLAREEKIARLNAWLDRMRKRYG